jgi:hypothetical protein
MKGFSTLLSVVAGAAIAPYSVALIEYFIPSAPSWFPYAVVLIFAGVLYGVGVDVLRPIALALAVGVVLFGLGQQYVPQRIDFLGVDVERPF